MGEFEEKLNSILSSPAEMEKILGLARELSGGQSETPKERRDTGPQHGPEPDIFSALRDLDPRTLKLLGRLMGEYSGSKDDKQALVASMKPYVRPERRQVLDRAVKIAKLARLARIAFSELGGDSDLRL